MGSVKGGVCDFRAIRSNPSCAASGSSSITTAGLPATREKGGMTVFGATTAPSSIRTQSLMIANLPYSTIRQTNNYRSWKGSEADYDTTLPDMNHAPHECSFNH